MPISFQQLMLRADESLLEEMIGKPSVGLLNQLLPNQVGIAKLRDCLTELKSPESLLLDQKTRKLLIDVLRKPDAVELAQCLGFPGVAPYEEASGRLNIEQQQALLSFFGLTFPIIEEFEHQSITELSPNYKLFSHQRNAAKRVVAELYSKDRRVLLHMPTGSGKTRTAMHIIAQHLILYEPAVVVWLATSEELCEQAAQEFETAWKFLGNREVQLFRWWGDAVVNAEEPQDGLIVGGLAKLHSAAKRDNPFLAFLGDKVSLVVFDEAHQAVAQTYALVVESMLARSLRSSLLGLSATPGRSWSNRDADRVLVEFFAQSKITLKVEGYDNPVQYLCQEGYLAKPTFRLLNSTSSIDLSSAEIASLSLDLDVPSSILHKLADDQIRNIMIIREIEKLANRHRRIIVFASTVDHAIVIAIALRIAGLKACDVTSRSPSMDRSRNIAWFKSDSIETRILCNYGILTTGFDAPATSAALIARPTKSLVLYSQMVGRAIRGVKAGGNDKAEIVTVVDPQLPGFGNIQDAFSNWEDVW